MSKKKRRFKRQTRHTSKRSTSVHVVDRHHLCFTRRNWGNEYARTLRQLQYCSVYIPKEGLHRFIHQNMAGIPAPSSMAAKSALEQLQYLKNYGAINDNDPIEKRLNLLAALFDCVAQPTADGFRKQLSIVHKYYEKPPP